jgi:hypothetical protein
VILRLVRHVAACTILCVFCLNDAVVLSQTTPTPTPAPAADAAKDSAAATAEASRPPAPNTLMDGTAVKLRLSETISSSDAKAGQQVPFEVTEDVVVQGVTVIPKGAQALATVTEAQSKRSMGRGGKLNVNVDSVRLADSEKAQLRAVRDEKGGGHVGAMTGAMVATAIVFFPAAPLFLFIKGKDITIPKGTEVTAFVQGDMKLDMAKFGAGPATAVAEASVMVESNVAGADIDVDGNFMGSTPSTVAVAPGSHTITVKKKGYQDWTRTMNLAGAGAKVDAELELLSTGAQ